MIQFNPTIMQFRKTVLGFQILYKFTILLILAKQMLSNKIAEYENAYEYILIRCVKLSVVVILIKHVGRYSTQKTKL